MADGQAQSLVAARHLKRARSLLRDATRELAQSADLDTVAHTHVRDHRHLEQLTALLQVALTEHPAGLDVVVISPNQPQPTTAKETHR